MNENPLNITALNDFIFCPVSIYFHNLYGDMERNLYQSTDQINGTDAHKSVDEKSYSKGGYIQSLEVYCEQYNLIGKIDLYVGILHTQFYMRKSLVCDIVEPFRVLIDKQIKKGINLGQFKEKDFEIYDGKWCLKYQKSAEYSGVFLSALSEHKEEIFIYVRDFYRSFMKNELKENFPKWDV